MAKTTTHSLKLLAATAALAFTTTLATPAMALDDEVSVTIQKADLATEQGLEKVYADLTNAAEKACYDTHARRPLSARAFEKACFEDLMEDFISQVDNVRLAAYHVRDDINLG